MKPSVRYHSLVRFAAFLLSARAACVFAADTPAVAARPDTLASPFTMHWASYDRVTIDGSIPGPTSQLRPIPFIASSTFYLGTVVGMHIYQSNAWWSKDRRSFHFVEDWSENMQNDKFGHFFGAYMQAYGMREVLLLDGFSDEAAHNWASVVGAMYALYVEVEDGFASSWGFSPTDAYADLGGASFFFAQRYLPVLQNFHEKWSYWPSKFLGSGSIPGQQRTVMDDYQGQSYWWSCDLWNLLPASSQAWYPKWLQVSVGYTARKYGPYAGPPPPNAPDPAAPQYTDLADTREVYIGLDYSLPNLIPKSNIPFVDWLVQSLDNFHFPAPALRVAPSLKFFLLYPIQFRIGSISF